MNAATREHVVRLLESYQQRARQIALLRYELDHPAHVTPEEMIGAMSFARGDGTRRAAGHISNKTLYIALNYQEETERINTEASSGIAIRLTELEQEQDRLAYYVSLLEQRQSEVIRLFYFEGCSWEEIAAKLCVALRTTHKIKNRALDKLSDLYAFAETLQ